MVHQGCSLIVSTLIALTPGLQSNYAVSSDPHVWLCSCRESWYCARLKGTLQAPHREYQGVPSIAKTSVFLPFFSFLFFSFLAIVDLVHLSEQQNRMH